MSEAKGAMDSVRNFGRNLNKHKKALTISGIAAAIILTWGYNSMLSNAELKLPNEVSKSANVSTRDLGVSMGATGAAQVNYQQDITGINDANAKLNKLEEEAYSARVYSAAENNTSEIISRGTTNSRIRFKSDQEFKRVEREVATHEINVPNITAETIVTPPKMTFTDEVPTQQLVQQDPQSGAPLLVQNTQAGELEIQQNIAGQFTKILEAKAQQQTALNKNDLNYTQTEFYEIQKQEQEQEQAQKLALEQAQLQLAMKPQEKLNYNSGNTAVKSARNEVSSQGETLFTLGQIENAITLLGAKNLNLGPIKAQLTSGQYAGAILNGTVTQGAEKLNFNFTSMYLPNDSNLIQISAIALQHDTMEVGTATSVDKREFLRYVVRPTLKAGAAVGEYYANDTSTTTTAAGTVMQSSAAKSADHARKVAMGEAMNAINNDIDSIDTSTIITQDQYTPIKVYFTAEVKYKTATEAPSVGRDNATNNFVQPLGQDNSFDLNKLQQQLLAQPDAVVPTTPTK